MKKDFIDIDSNIGNSNNYKINFINLITIFIVLLITTFIFFILPFYNRHNEIKNLNKENTLYISDIESFIDSNPTYYTEDELIYINNVILLESEFYNIKTIYDNLLLANSNVGNIATYNSIYFDMDKNEVIINVSVSNFSDITILYDEFILIEDFISVSYSSVVGNPGNYQTEYTIYYE